MGYECPVCATPQADRRHLADHMAVTAITHGDEHARWLDEHVPDWSEHSPRELGAAVAEHAPPAEYGQAFEDTVETRGDHAEHADHEDAPADLEDAVAGASGRGRGRGDLTDEQRAVVREARALTREMLDDDGPEGDGDAEDEAGGDDTGDVTQESATTDEQTERG